MLPIASNVDGVPQSECAVGYVWDINETKETTPTIKGKKLEKAYKS